MGEEVANPDRVNWTAIRGTGAIVPTEVLVAALQTRVFVLEAKVVELERLTDRLEDLVLGIEE